MARKRERSVKIYVQKVKDYWEVSYSRPYADKKRYPIHSLRDKELAIMYADGVASGWRMAAKHLVVSESVTVVPEVDDL